MQGTPLETTDENVMTTAQRISKLQTYISYTVAYQVAKAGKSYTVAEEIVKPCLLQILQGLQEYNLTLSDIPDLEEFVKTIPMSDTTISRRVKVMAESVKQKTIEAIKESPIGYSLQLDESVDVDSKAQLAVFARYFQFNFLMPLRI